MQQYFAEVKQRAGGIRFDDQSLWSRIKSTVDAWIANACADKHVNKELVRRTKDVTLYEIRRLASRCPSRESRLLVQFSIALKEEIIAL